MAWSALWDVVALLASFAGGAFGAALGALPAFIFTGFMVIAGETAAYVNPEAAAITGSVAFGPPFSPAISFAGGAAATAYAAKRGYMESGFDYHNAKDIAYALGTKPDVLAVGGAFGVVGYWLTIASQELTLPWDPIAMGVVLSALIHRLALGYDLIGRVRGGGLLDMSPFEREEMRDENERVIGEPAATDGGATATRRLMVEPWLPQQYKWGHVAVLGVVGGLLSAYLFVATGSVFLGFGISAATLLFLNCGVENTPVTHHITLVGAAGAEAVMADGTGLIAGGAVVGLLVGGVFGLIAALFGELFQRVFYAHSDTHWDPPAAAIVFGSFLVAVCYIAGVFPGSSYVPALGF